MPRFPAGAAGPPGAAVRSARPRRAHAGHAAAPNRPCRRDPPRKRGGPPARNRRARPRTPVSVASQDCAWLSNSKSRTGMTFGERWKAPDHRRDVTAPYGVSVTNGAPAANPAPTMGRAAPGPPVPARSRGLAAQPARPCRSSPRSHRVCTSREVIAGRCGGGLTVGVSPMRIVSPGVWGSTVRRCAATCGFRARAAPVAAGRRRR